MPSFKKQYTWNNLSLYDTVSVNTVRNVSASNILNFPGDTDLQHKIKLADNILVFYDGVTSNRIYYISTSNSATFLSYPSPNGSKNRSIDQGLSFSDSAYSALRGLNVSSQLEFNHYFSQTQPKYLSALNNLLGGWEEVDPEDLLTIDLYDPEQVAGLFENIGLRQTLNLRKSKYYLTAGNYLSFSQSGAKFVSGIASNHIHLSDSVETVLYELPINYLNLQQTVVCHTVQDIENLLNLTQVAVLDGIYPLSANNVLNLRNAASPIFIRFCDYSPGISEDIYDYPAPSPITPTLIRRHTTVLTWPYNSPLLTVELRNPNFDNVEQFEFRRINRRTRGGDLDLYRDENWPKVKRLIYSFTYLSETNRADLFKFLQRSLGTEIGILDFESRQWHGLLLTPANAISEPKRNGFSFSLEFEGELA